MKTNVKECAAYKTNHNTTMPKTTDISKLDQHLLERHIDQAGNVQLEAMAAANRRLGISFERQFRCMWRERVLRMDDQDKFIITNFPHSDFASSEAADIFIALTQPRNQWQQDRDDRRRGLAAFTWVVAAALLAWVAIGALCWWLFS